ncbi:MAG: L,D-transpeptidase [Verrucomicrobiota bacterium]|nr:L,D-transpeptidase [Verrucomicrobiota bacterium]
MSTFRSAVLRALTGAALLCAVGSCATPDKRHRIIVSVPEQRMMVLDQGVPIATYPVSTSKFAISDAPGSRGTPLGELEIAKKIGTAAPAGAVFHSRKPTGEVLQPDAPGRDPIVSRILWLRGLEPQNDNAYGRYIYIHGTAEERNIGTPASYGCVRMKSRDVIELYSVVGNGARVTIVNAPLSAAVPTPPPAAPNVAAGSAPARAGSL